MVFKIDLTPPFKAELDSVSGGFINKYPFRRKRRPKLKQSPTRKISIWDLIQFRKGGEVKKTKRF